MKTQRRKFEDWARSLGYKFFETRSGGIYSGEYSSTELQHIWSGWKAGWKSGKSDALELQRLLPVGSLKWRR